MVEVVTKDCFALLQDTTPLASMTMYPIIDLRYFNMVNKTRNQVSNNFKIIGLSICKSESLDPFEVSKTFLCGSRVV